MTYKNFVTNRPTRHMLKTIKVQATVYHSDKQIGTVLDEHFLFFRIGHAAKGSLDSEVTDRAHYLSRILCALDG